jgi:hypothetical protein
VIERRTQKRLIKLSEEQLDLKFKRARKMHSFCSRHFLSTDFLRKHSDKWDTNAWKMITWQQQLDEQFINDFKDKLCWRAISVHYKMDSDFFEKNISLLDIESVVRRNRFDEVVLQKLLDNQYGNSNVVNSYCIFSYQKLSESFIEKNIKHLDKEYKQKRHGSFDLWSTVSATQKLSESFIEKYAEKVNWENISFSQSLSEKFIEKYAKKIHWNKITKSKLSQSFIRKYANRLNWYLVCKNNKLDEDFIKENIERVDFSAISKKSDLSDTFIEEYADKLDWYYLCSNKQLSEHIMDKFSHKLSWWSVSRKQQMSIEFIVKNLDKIKKTYLKLNKKVNQEELDKRGVYVMLELA